MSENITALLNVPPVETHGFPIGLTITALLIIIFGATFIAFALIKYWRRMAAWARRNIKSMDGKPTTIAFFFQRDACSRLFVEFGEAKLNDCVKLIIVRETRDGAIDMLSTEDGDSVEGMLYKATHMVITK